MNPDFFERNENRRFDRRQLMYYLKVYHGKSDRLAGYLGDISSKGLMVFSQGKIQPGKVLKLRIDLDKEFGLGDFMTFDSKALWCKPDVNPDYFIIGFEHLDIDTQMVDKVLYLMQKYGFNE